MIQYVPLASLVLAFAATLWRGRSVRRESGISPFAFFDARGRQRAFGALFILSTLALIAAALTLAITAPAPSAWTLPLGAVLSLGGVAIMIEAQREMRLAWRIGVRAGDAPHFIQSGLFRLSRNPIFVSMIAMALGIALANGTWWAWLAAAGFALACHLQVKIEEPHLEEQFGETYAQYLKAVPRWLLF